MKTFSVNKNSWHYKMNVSLCQTNQTLQAGQNAERYVQSKDNLCSYWQLTLWSMFKVLVVAAFVFTVAAFILFVLYKIGYAFMYYTLPALVGTGLILGVIAFSVGITMLGTWLGNRKREKLNKILYNGETETSLAKAKYSSWKSGICVPVEFKG
jgi:hypothetical protein